MTVPAATAVTWRFSQSGHSDRPEKVVAVACGGWHSAVIGEKGGVWLCGRGEFGRLGLGDQASKVRGRWGRCSDPRVRELMLG